MSTLAPQLFRRLHCDRHGHRAATAPATTTATAGQRRHHSPGGRGTSSLHVGFFSVLIPNTLLLFFCARRPLHRGASLGGIVSDPLRAGGGITTRGDAVRRPFMLVSFLFLIPNTLFLFFCARRLGRSSEGSPRILCGPAARPRGITARGDAVRCPFILVSYSILVPNALSSFFSP